VVIAAATTYYLLNSLYKFKLAFDSLSGAGTIPVSDEEVAAVDERALPRYTVLVPLYREAGIVHLLTHNIRRLDYPAAKLEVLLLCEEDDDETIAAIEASDLPDNYHLILVPEGQPRTKPRACNYGLLLARGQLCVIYDAEDRPDPDQLKKVVIAFSKTRGNLVCIQGKLNYFNRHQNLLTRWFAAEYAMWFDLVLPGLHFNRHPIPLGGTSNHFLSGVLRELDAWDPFNVTEDADLGIRLWQRGYATAMVDSVTLEEANSRTGNWVRQRSRWIKGYMQTWLVHMRHPLRLLRAIGIGPFLSLQMTVGGILVTLLNPLFWGLAVTFVLFDPAWLRDLFPGPLYYIAAAQLLVGNFVHVYLFLIGLGRREYWDVIPAMLIVPAYWVLMSVAGWKGLIQLFTKPFYWEKTEHGLVDVHEYLEEPL
jgi:glycosyltransferase XagB